MLNVLLMIKYMKIKRKIVLLAAALVCGVIGVAEAAGGNISVARAFYELARQNNTQKIETLLERGYSLESVDERGYNSVCISVIRQNRPAYKVLTGYGADKSPECLKKIPDSAYRRFFGLSPKQTPVKSYKPDSPYLIGTAALAYLLGCVNGSILVSKYIFRDDIRTHGSGNAGLTNFYRTFGTKGVVGVLLSDILKAVIAVLLGGFVFGYFFGLPMVGKLAATSFVLLGHMYPVTFHFHGGKGVLSGVSALMVIDWRVALLALAVFLLVVALTQYVSLGSICAALTFVVCLWLFYHNVCFEVLGAVPAGLLIFAHRSNIKRLLHGTENKFSLHRKEDAAK